MPRSIHTNVLADVYVEAESPVPKHSNAHIPRDQEYEEDTGAREAIANNTVMRNEEEKRESLR